MVSALVSASMVVDRSAIKHRFAERTTTILLAR
jgi:hypothetical protein